MPTGNRSSYTATLEVPPQYAAVSVDRGHSIIVAIPPCDRSAAIQPPAKGATRRMLHGDTIGTTWSAQFFAGAARTDTELFDAIQRELASVDRQMSHWRPDSNLSRFNEAAAGEWVILPEEFFAVLEFAMGVALESGGAYDPTVGPLVDEWGFGPGLKPRGPPGPAALDRQRRRCGWTRVELDPKGRRARHQGELGLDLSAVAKGFAVDQLARALERSGVTSYLVEIGGEFRAGGVTTGRQPWWVGVEVPLEGSDPVGDGVEIRVALSGWSMATSGDYRRYFERGSRRWAHTIDPWTGEPACHGLASVSVVHGDCMAADAYSTALMVLGPESGLEFVDRHGLAAVFIVRIEGRLEVLGSERFRRMTE